MFKMRGVSTENDNILKRTLLFRKIDFVKLFSCDLLKVFFNIFFLQNYVFSQNDIIIS